ncbi:cupin domain-containing protein [Alkalihalobacterium elongatum]|uniref:cupin domain-containing protein n=1 Tax=Alkalihalobacterium elongatum TaxID=2675466 RepID=UPI001C1F6DB7|nr:cupin domain-containing protein [Alkalihalobacterium elongatum]
MYYVPQMYPYPYYVNVGTPSYHAGYMSRNGQANNQANDQQVVEAILSGIKREASAIDLYSRLAHEAPNQELKNEMLHALEVKKSHLNQFSNIYTNLTGTQPVYQIEKMTFNSYREGLQKAYAAEVDGYQEYQNSSLLTQHPLVRQSFLQACTSENVSRFSSSLSQLKDYGSQPFVVDIEEVTTQNNTFRTALWTGKHLQLTLMSIAVGEDIGLERHPDLDQFIRIEQGEGLVQMGDSQFNLNFEQRAFADYAIFVPAGKWHNLTNTGDVPLKLYSIYAPPQHPFGTVHETKEIAMAAEEHHHH